MSGLMRALVGLALPVALTACAINVHDHGAAAKGEHEMHGKLSALASLSPVAGGSVIGSVMFHDMGDHLMVHAQVRGLEPGSEHGFHVHEKGSCASADFTSAGGHFNPDAKAHGNAAGEHHAGDIPNLKADAQGIVDQKFMLHGVTLSAGDRSIVGRALILHATPDDYKTQPTGNSGPRIGCGVIASHG